jgi:deoxyribodipyrimidine photolyase-related protein
MPRAIHPLRHLVIVLGDQLDPDAAAFDGFDLGRDAVWMAEVAEESTHVWSSKPRTALFLAAMRHYAEATRALGRLLHYTRLDDAGNCGTLAGELAAAVERLEPASLVMTAPGDARVLRALRGVATAHALPLDLRADRHFFGTVTEFAAWARPRGQTVMEDFYRDMRRRHHVLMDGDAPAGGRWNFDTENRNAFGPGGPTLMAAPPCFAPDAITREVLALVDERFAQHPGRLATFAWPVTRPQALEALHRFVAERQPEFGRWQDALWPREPWLWHSQLSAALNLKLLDPREVVGAAEAAWRAGAVPLASAEGFIRQILGWREYVRGIYWTRMPDYLESNALQAHAPLPAFYWHGRTPMACLADTIAQTLEHGYAHHLQRLMVTGLYALLLGVEPRAVHAWYLAVYVDAVEWVELPNTIGMSQFADGGGLATKPYIASGRYIERMSAGSLCARCRFRPGERVGERACPFTTLYWDFMLRHASLLAANPRTRMQVRSLASVDEAERARLRQRADEIRSGALDD